MKTVVKLNGGNGGGDDTQDAPWYYKWSGLRKYDDNGTPIEYSAEETALKIAGETVAVTDYQTEPEGTSTAYSFFIRNEIPPTEIKAKKVWKQDHLPEGVSIKFKITATVEDSPEDIFGELNVECEQEITLTGGTDATDALAWEAVWSDLPVYYQGKEISYTVTETEYKIGDRNYADLIPAAADNPAAEGYDFSYTNELPKIDIPVIKTWVNAEPAGGDYVKIGLYDTEGNPVNEPGMENPYVITIEYDTVNNSWPTDAANFGDLPVYDVDGNVITYVVKEIEVKLGGSVLNDPVIIKRVYGNEDGKVVADSETIATAEIKNTVGAKTYKVKKNWGEADPPEGAVITIELKGTITGDAPADLAGLGVDPVTVTLNGGQTGGHDTVEKPWEYEWTSLPKYDNAGNEITYSAEEKTYIINGTAINLTYVPPVTDSQTEENTTIFTNLIPTVTITATKEWEAEPLPEGTVVEVTVKGTIPGESAGTTEDVTEAVFRERGDRPTKEIPGNASVSWEDLPKYIEGKAITYTVEETKVTISGEVKWDKSAADAGENPYQIQVVSNGNTTTFKNKLSEIHLLKVDQTNRDNPLKGAVFELRRNHQLFGKAKTTADDGTIDFTKLPIGEYELAETSAPPGYAILVNSIKFEINAQGMIVPDESNFGEGVVEYDGDTFKFTVGNQPGTALPMTGGPGTNLLYLFGTMLTALAGAGLLMRKRRRNAA